jgi:hypothetical protein
MDDPRDGSVTEAVLGAGVVVSCTWPRDGNRDFRWVLGHRTAKEFGLPAEMGLAMLPTSRYGRDDSTPIPRQCDQANARLLTYLR